MADDRQMKIFIYESVSAEGESNNALMAEGELMLRAVIRDFKAIDKLRILTATRDTFHATLETCDAALIIAPETDGKLEALTYAVIDKGKVNLGLLY